MEKQKAESKEQKVCRRARGANWFVLSMFCFWFCLLVAFAQRSTTKVKNFSVPEYFEPPHETQMKSLLEGAEAEPESGGRILITRLKLATFTEDGAPQMTVLAPHCVFDSSARVVRSPGPLQVRTSDGKLLLEGEGFTWSLESSTLIISNRGRAEIRGTVDNSFLP